MIETSRAVRSSRTASRRSLTIATAPSRPTSGPSGRMLRSLPPGRRATTWARLPGRDRQPLAAKRPVACHVRRRRATGRPIRRLVDEDGSRGGPRPASRAAVLTTSPATMPWPTAPTVIAASPLTTPARVVSRGSPTCSPTDGDGGHELDGRPHGALGIVLVGDGGAPHRHDGVADELLDRPAVAGDDRRGTSRSRRPWRSCTSSGSTTLGEGREGHEVDEQDRHEPSFGRRTG